MDLGPPGHLALAPMDGVTDHVYRALFTARAKPGSVDYCVSEFIRVTDRPMPRSMIRRSCPEVDEGGTTPAGTPVMVQLLGGQPEPLAATAVTAIAMGAWGIDLNFGCPAKLVNRHDGGASILKAPERLERIVACVRAAVPKDRPVSAKIRLGWESHDEVVSLARAAERGGANFLTIHGRTKLEMYGPPADWKAIGSAREAVRIPVVANGDLNDAASLLRCRSESGCSHFMVGRGSMGRPELLTQEPCNDESAALRHVSELLAEYVERLAEAGNSEERQVARVKQWLSLGSSVNPKLAPLFDRIKRLRDRDAVSKELVH
jgi:tRNA-dihydrouridine synthase C